MGFLDRIAKGVEFRSSGLANPQAWLTESLAGTASYSGQRVSVDKALGIPAVWAAVRSISETVAQLPFKVYRRVDGDRVEARAHRSWRMLHDRPNSLASADRFWQSVTAHLLLYGNAFIEKGRSPEGLVEELWLHDPQTIRVEVTAAREKRFFDDTPGSRGEWNATSMLHVFSFSLNGFWGESVISKQRQGLGTVIAREEFEGGFYKRGATFRGLLRHPQRLSPDAQKNLGKSFEAAFGGSGAAHGTPVLEEGMEFTPITMALKDLEFVASKQLSATEVAIMFGLPPSWLGGMTGDSLHYSTREQDAILVVQNAVAPHTNAIAKAVSTDVSVFPQQETFYAEFVHDALLRADSKGRAEFYKALADVNAITVNEIRARENLPPLPDGDEAPTTLAPPQTETQEQNGAIVLPADVTV